MKSNRVCPHCNKVFESIEGRVFSNHVRWCDKNPKGNKTENLKTKTQERFNNELGEKKEFIVKCHKCNKEFKVIEREKQFPKKEKYFCSVSCRNSKEHSQETKNKIRESINIYFGNNPLKEPLQIVCEECGSLFTSNKKSRRFCSRKCSGKFCAKLRNKNSKSTELEKYRRQCDFNFNPYHYPDEFNIELLERYGFYSPSNKNNNINGVSKDHMISVRYGFDNNIDCKILSHPANCELLIHNDNISKHKRCSITYEELLKRIEKWNSKYGDIV